MSYYSNAMRIRYLDGARIARALSSGARRLEASARSLDAINVFPVPDGDTGTNMAATVRTMAAGSAFAPASFALGAPASSALRQAADSALEGARGNSGAILAQFFHSLAEELRHEIRVGADSFARAAQSSVAATYRALSSPKEGTILTVLRAWAESLSRHANIQRDFEPLLASALDSAKSALEKTRYLRPEMAKAGVVDAGAQGFIHFLEGVQAFIAAGRLRDALRRVAAEAEEVPAGAAENAVGAIEELGAFRYCTEATLRGAGLDAPALRAAAEAFGDSVVVAGGGSMVKVHAHTDDPPALFRTLEGYASIERYKVDDMRLQHAIASERRRCVLAVDSAGDLPDAFREAHAVERVPVRVCAGGRDMPDKDAIAAAELDALLLDPAAELPTTSQPSAMDFRRKFEFLAAHADGVLYLGLSGALSGTLDAARRAVASLSGGERILAVDTRSASIGIALLARRAAEAIEAGADAKEAAELVERLRKGLHFRIAVPSLRNLIRSGRISRLRGLALEGLGIRPILKVDDEGKVAKAGAMIGRGRRSPAGEPSFIAGERALLAAVAKRIGADRRNRDFAVGHVVNAAGAERLAAALTAAYAPNRPVIVTAVSPAIAVHIGPGGLGIAWMDE